jgi:hypothetical protein
VHLVFFLHITTAPDNTNNILALAFGIRSFACNAEQTRRVRASAIAP